MVWVLQSLSDPAGLRIDGIQGGDISRIPAIGEPLNTVSLRGCVRSWDSHGLNEPGHFQERISFRERILWERDSYGQEKSVSE
jgi:hypothetical protein